jgi:hypothetical protein
MTDEAYATHDGDETSDEQLSGYATTRAEVGVGRNETYEVAETVGEFDHREVPNNDTTTWERIHQPRESGDYPYVAARYKVTCSGLKGEADDEFHITRSVVACSARSDVPNFPYAETDSMVHCESVVSAKTVMSGISEFEDALTFASNLMEGNSTSSRLPPELSESQRKGYREWASGQVEVAG